MFFMYDIIFFNNLATGVIFFFFGGEGEEGGERGFSVYCADFIVINTYCN